MGEGGHTFTIVKHGHSRLCLLVEQCDASGLGHLCLSDSAKRQRRTFPHARSDLPLNLDIQPLPRQLPAHRQHQPPMRRLGALGHEARFDKVYLSIGKDAVQRAQVVGMEARIERCPRGGTGRPCGLFAVRRKFRVRGQGRGAWRGGAVVRGPYSADAL